MIEPAYRRDQLWSRPRLRFPVPSLAGVIAGGALTLSLLLAVSPARIDDDDNARHSEAAMLVAKLVEESFPAWHEHHTGCPHRLSQLLPSAHLDPWGHALHYTCDPQLVRGDHFAVVSAGPDGVFGTADDIAAHD
jgi:hypothetical protein